MIYFSTWSIVLLINSVPVKLGWCWWCTFIRLDTLQWKAKGGRRNHVRATHTVLGGEEGEGVEVRAGGETMWERGWGWHRLPVSHLQFPSMSVIRGALWRAAWWRASSRIFWSNFSVNNREGSCQEVNDHQRLHLCQNLTSFLLFAISRLMG